MNIRSLIVNMLGQVIRYKKTKNPLIYMTLLVKNEEDVLEENIIFHKKMGIDGFIITDNGSTDKTADIIKKYIEKGWIKEAIYDESEGYKQVIYVDQMIRIAKEKYHADWVINCDADELWYCKQGNYKKILSKSFHNVLKCSIYNMLPTDKDNFWKSEWRVVKSVDSNKYDLPKFNLYTQQIEKVLHRTSGYKIISMGNHNVKMRLKSIGYTSNIIIYHYNIRSKEHFAEKMIGGGKEISKNSDNNIGEHWKYFFEMSKRADFDIDKIFDKFIGNEYFSVFKERKVIVKDRTILNFFNNLYKGKRKYA